MVKGATCMYVSSEGGMYRMDTSSVQIVAFSAVIIFTKYTRASLRKAFNPIQVICSGTRPLLMDQWHWSTLASNSKVSGDHNQETALQISAGSSRPPLS